MIISLPERIPQSQVYPFYFYAKRATQVANGCGYEVREISLERFLAAPDSAPRASLGPDLVLFQVWIDKTASQVAEIACSIRQRWPGARVVFLDPFAPSDLRYAAALSPHIDGYVKKHVLRDRTQYGRPTRGDTNLTDWYGTYFGEKLPEECFEIPEGFLSKLIVGPSFSMAPSLLPDFYAHTAPPSWEGRRFDLHARLGGAGTNGWYERMREQALLSVKSLSGVRVTPTGFIGKRQYMAELRKSRICFSPFGYGEVCWRDYEAAAAGAVLLKPRMDHIETGPDFFEAGVTYLPLQWDFSDLEEQVEYLLGRPALAAAMANAAFERLSRHARSDAFAVHLEGLLLGSPPPVPLAA